MISQIIVQLISIQFILSSCSIPTVLDSIETGYGGYSRTIQLMNGKLLTCAHPVNIYQRSFPSDPSSVLLSTINTPTMGSNEDFTNCYLHQIRQNGAYFGRLLLSLRHHYDCDGVKCKYYSIKIYYSNDNGETWQNAATDIGIVEEIFYTQTVFDQSVSLPGLWEPFLFEIRDPNNMGIYQYGLYIYYAREYRDNNNHLQQEIIQKQSFDGGIHWISETIVTKSGVRDGMPAVTQISDGTLICSFERNVGAMRLSTVKSFDGGKTWHYLTTLQDVFIPTNYNYKSSASGIGYSQVNGKIIIISILNNGFSNQRKIVYLESYDGYKWSDGWTLVSDDGLWPNVYNYNGNLYIEYDNGGKIYTTTKPVNYIPTEYVGWEYNFNRWGNDITNYSPIPNIETKELCFQKCQHVDKCVVAHWNIGKACWLKYGYGINLQNGDTQFINNANMYSVVLTSRWYYGVNTDGNISNILMNVETKEQCLYECLVDGNCKHVVYNNGSKKCYLKSEVPTLNLDIPSWNTWIWIVPQ
eukprot:301964_1